eukprot:TRINITY_DN70565_c0_g1_i1.p1 TRINITY_DN70565_c0_g1~~TRINITY_DN70565_c0_g1_i1.p1  ORF type:complete len:658 (+),score=184.87 TRINITY_DN70565_c0_g1_i1:32-1975(+)
MAWPSPAWLLVALLAFIILEQNAELDLQVFACRRQSIQQVYDAFAFVLGLQGADLLSVGASYDTAFLKGLVVKCGLASRGDSVLEVGFGSGHLALLLLGGEPWHDNGTRGSVQRYDGVELSEGMLNITAKRLGDDPVAGVAPLRWSLHLSESAVQSGAADELTDDAASSGFSKALRSSYSHAFALGVLDSMTADELGQTLEELHRRLRDGNSSRLCVSVLADFHTRWSVRIYKAFWRSIPALLGGRRPLAFRDILEDYPGYWEVEDTWIDETAWLPSEVFVLKKGKPDEETLEQVQTEVQEERVAILLRWASHAVRHSLADAQAQEAAAAKGGAGSPVVPDAASEVRSLLATSSDGLPLELSKDIVTAWLPDVATSSLVSFLSKDIEAMRKADILEELHKAIEQMPPAVLLQEMRARLRTWDAKSLEVWLTPPVDNLTVDELREHMSNTLDGVMENMHEDVEGSDMVLRYREQVRKALSRDELLQLNGVIEKEVIVPPSEMSRGELENWVLANMEQLPREELEYELIQDHQSRSGDELRSMLLSSLDNLTRDEMEDQVVEAFRLLDSSSAASVRRVVREVAEKHLSEADVAFLREAALAAAPTASALSGEEEEAEEAMEATAESEVDEEGRAEADRVHLATHAADEL